jgi:hypothetical protein
MRFLAGQSYDSGSELQDGRKQEHHKNRWSCLNQWWTYGKRSGMKLESLSVSVNRASAQSTYMGTAPHT